MGDIDCSKRLCPYGTDVLDTKDDTHYGLIEQKYQEQTILLSALEGDYDDIEGKTFALTFTSRLNETFTTIPIHLTDSTSADVTDVQNDIKLALLKLPNGVIDGVKVTVDFIDANEMYKLVTDKIFTATTFVANIGMYDSRLESIDSVVGSMSTGCTIGGSSFQGPTILQQINGTATLSHTASGDIDISNNQDTGSVTAGGSTITTSSNTPFAYDDYITGGKGSISPGTRIGAGSVSTTTYLNNATAVLTTTNEIFTKLVYSCLVNGQVVARFSMTVASGSKTVTAIVVGYGGLVNGCVIRDVDGTAPTDLAEGTSIYTFDITGGAISKQA